ncbi:helix-turn-helix domain-containing protein [Xanthomonas arboricola]|uniref:helix-turn-helix domain-containing protein n=1 Tax=Xanthomonas arboricola TaxID=56448 RepID=UPI003EBB2B13
MLRFDYHPGMEYQAQHAEFAARLRNARESAGLTQREVAALVGVNHSQVSRYEAGVAMPRPGVLKRLANGIGVPLEQLRDGEDSDVTVEVLVGEGDELLARFAISAEIAAKVEEEAHKLGISAGELLKTIMLQGAEAMAAEKGLELKR